MFPTFRRILSDLDYAIKGTFQQAQKDADAKIAQTEATLKALGIDFYFQFETRNYDKLYKNITTYIRWDGSDNKLCITANCLNYPPRPITSEHVYARIHYASYLEEFIIALTKQIRETPWIPTK